MKKTKDFISDRFILKFITFAIFFILILLGLILPKGIYGIKLFKTITYIAQKDIYNYSFLESNGSFKFFKILIIFLLILTAIYLISSPSKIISYFIAILFLLLLFFVIPSILKSIDYKENSEKINLFNDKKSEIEIQDFKENEKIDEISFFTEKDNSNRFYLLYIFLLFFIITITLSLILLFLINLIKKIISEIKETGLNLFFFNIFKKDKSKKILVDEVKTAINEAIDLIDTGNNIKDTIINCYLTLIYSVKKYARESKDPSLTSREFKPILLSLGLYSDDIDNLTYSFERAKYSNQTILLEEKEIVVKSLRNCIKKLKKEDL